MSKGEKCLGGVYLKAKDIYGSWKIAKDIKKERVKIDR